jgi:hypothetical protein
MTKCEKKLRKLKASLKALREPRNGREVATRLQWERLHRIIIRRYE